MQFAIAIHGGAGPLRRLSDEARQQRIEAMRRALQAGTDILKEGGEAIDAVEAVVRILEDEPGFNAGRGAVSNDAGEHELDASIMDGRGRQGGAVAGVRNVKNPISLARLVMTETRHVLLAAGGAEQFAREQGVELVDQDYFGTPPPPQSPASGQPGGADGQRADGDGHPAHAGAAELEPAELEPADASYLGTVGCVALDAHGNLAAGTSTGGISGKKFGRIGDSPIIGAGTWADNETCAVSCTGIGEQYIRNVVAYDISALMQYRGMSLEEAGHEVLHNRLNPGDGGIIAVGHDGSIWMDFTTGGMIRAAADSNGRFEVLWEPTQESEGR